MLPLVDMASDAVIVVSEARENDRDGSYGRLDGDSALAVSAGAAFDVHGVRGSLDLRYRYMQTAGVFVTYEEGFGAGSEPLRVGVAGFELRPLFLGRYLSNLETLHPRLDMLLDSFALEIGGFVGQPAARNFADVAGLSFGVGFELPLLPRASGPFLALRGAVRWSREALSGAAPTTIDVIACVLTVSLGWQAIFGGHVVR